ncbi:DUF4252 domain-containing protein [Flavobacterium sp.]|uniref:DUF4252 domain-containing protein n=1 Tax=Flavobacterium sp. TaxID=239 RepID=UPI0012037499|nr:DUF4252 domain-containing protein [Flavobacterium sp.]RZJ71797.1 MAG: DUF4252 domain-containing protein [Flavobacterium sp.]
MKRFILVAMFALALASCSSEPTLQKYFVEKQEKPNFVVLDIGQSVLKVKEDALTPEQRKALNTFDKINVLAYTIKDSLHNEAEYKAESAKVKALLKDEKYQKLMSFGSGKDGGSISFVGKDDDHIEEFVIFANRKENGFVVVRIIGDEMNANSVMEMMALLRESNFDMEQLKPLQQLMKNKG